jgi:hypothetical protein
MNKSMRIMIVWIVFSAALFSGCGSESTSETNGTTGTELSPLTDDVKSFSPVLDVSNPATGGISLADWSAWDPTKTGSILGKLFDPANGGDECIYTKMEVFTSHLEMANEFADQWDVSGTYTKGNVTAIVDTSVSTIGIPFLAPDFDIPVERLITLQKPDDGLIVHLAFTLDDEGNQTIVEQYTIGDEASGVFYVWKLGENVRVWHASIATRKVQFMWEGNTADKSFKMTECTDAAGGNWEVMGGGSIASDTSEMAFMARNRENNQSLDEYYITITLQDLEGGAEQTISKKTGSLDGSGVLAYITVGNTKCFGFLGMQEYPDSLDDLAWNQ